MPDDLCTAQLTPLIRCQLFGVHSEHFAEVKARDAFGPKSGTCRIERVTRFRWVEFDKPTSEQLVDDG